MRKIFISYRRYDSEDVTGRIYDRLVTDFGRQSVFKDVDSIPIGVDFREYLDEQVTECHVLLAVIGKDWLMRRGAEGKSVLDDPRDFVRIEIECALKRRIPIIPLLVRGATVPPEDNLCSGLKELAYRNALPVRPDPDFHRDMNRLIDHLKREIGCREQEGRRKQAKAQCAVEVEKQLHLDREFEPEDEQNREEVKTDDQAQSDSECQTGEMVLIPKGAFLCGDEKESVRIEHDFLIDVSPVTNEAYNRFLEAGGYEMHEYWSDEGRRWMESHNICAPAYWFEYKHMNADHAVVGISYFEAEAFANWAGKRLPTEQEWEKAARGTDGRVYPWGDAFDPECCNHASGFFKTRLGMTTSVFKYFNGRSPYGCYDIVGNVWEWCANWYDHDQNHRVIRGGPWTINPSLVGCAYRLRLRPSAQYYSVGLRCARKA